MIKFGFITYDLQAFTEDCLYRIQTTNKWATIKAFPVIEHKNQGKSRIDYLPSSQKGRFYGVYGGRKTQEGFASNLNLNAVYRCVLESDVVVLFGLQGLSAIFAVIFAKVLKKPILTVSQTLPVLYETNRRWWVKSLKKFIYSCASMHISQSQATMDVLTLVYRIPQSKIISAQFEAGASLFRNEVAISRPFKGKTLIRIEGVINLLFVGNLHPFKGVGTIIEALHLITDKKKFVCHFAGPQAGKDRDIGTMQYWNDLAVKYSVVECVNFLGQLSFEQLIKAYSESDIVVLPTYRDMFPKVLVEAALFEKPLISTTASGANNSILIHNYNGFVIEPGDSTALASAIQKLSSEELRLVMGKRSKQIVDRLCTINDENEGFARALHAMADSIGLSNN
jgi:glycosyltransferase involved in cell wall biosynthesis